MELIKCKNLGVGYEGNIITDNINFSVNENDYLCIVGENGAGKSTLVKTILKLINPISGNIEYNNIKKFEIGYLSQQNQIQKDFPATVEEIVLSGTLSKNKGFFYSKKSKQIAKENMEKLNIYDKCKMPFKNLSGGQQQRVLLARALCSSSKILLLDEPITGLDPKVTNEFYELIKELNKDMTIIMITHDMKVIKDATHVLYLGKDNFFGTTDEYLNSDFSNLFRKENKK